MQGIKRVVYTDLFWETLEPIRTHARYLTFRAQIEEMILRRSQGATHVSPRDKPFATNSPLAGIWHWPFSRNPDVVLFYTVSNETLTLCMLGRHDDYAFGSNGAKAQLRTANRVWNAVSSGHVPRPGWKPVQWKSPSDILSNPYLHEHSTAALKAALEELREEAQAAPRYERIHGRSILEAEADEFDRWLAETELAQQAVIGAIAAKPLSPEAALRRIAERQAPAPAP